MPRIKNRRTSTPGKVPLLTDFVDGELLINTNDGRAWIQKLGTPAAVIELITVLGGTLIGFLTLHANPTANLHAATKQYVDNKHQWLILKDVKATGTNGGTFTSGAWRTRDLNTIAINQIPSGVSLTSNQFTLPAGTYLMHAIVPSLLVGDSKARIYNVTDSVEVPNMVGSATEGTVSGLSLATVNFTVASTIIGVVTIAAAKTFRIEHYCQTTRNTTGFGSAAGQTSEVYSQIFITKVNS